MAPRSPAHPGGILQCIGGPLHRLSLRYFFLLKGWAQLRLVQMCLTIQSQVAVPIDLPLLLVEPHIGGIFGRIIFSCSMFQLFFIKREGCGPVAAGLGGWSENVRTLRGAASSPPCYVCSARSDRFNVSWRMLAGVARRGGAQQPPAKAWRYLIHHIQTAWRSGAAAAPLRYWPPQHPPPLRRCRKRGRRLGRFLGRILLLCC